MNNRTRHDNGRVLGAFLLGAGIAGCVAALALIIERLALLTDPSHTPSCDFSPLVSCGSVMETSQASAFGFPNPLIGIVGFTVVATTGAALLAGARFAKWYWVCLQGGVLFGLAFVGWLIFQSIFRIGALCPYCMVVWAVMLPVFWFVTRRNATEGALGPWVAESPFFKTLWRWEPLILTIAYLSIVGLIAHQFWFYWSTLVGS